MSGPGVVFFVGGEVSGGKCPTFFCPYIKIPCFLELTSFSPILEDYIWACSENSLHNYNLRQRIRYKRVL